MQRFLAVFLLFSFAFTGGNTVPPTKITVFRKSGLDCSWDPSGSNRIAYSMKGADKYYDIHLAQPDGSLDTCITCDSKFLPNRHICCPSWHPSGKWILFVAEKEKHPGSSNEALPGIGSWSDIWLMSVDGKKMYKLVDLPSGPDHGVIAPRFSPDGKHLVWTDRMENINLLVPKKLFGYWNMKVCDFDFGKDSVPEIKNIHTLQPKGKAFYECYGFSPDGNKLIFCSDCNGASAWDEDIYTIDTNGTNLTRLTNKDYNEHAVFTPDGKHIVWMTNTNSKGTDWWMMNADGSGKKRITYMNDPKSAQYMKQKVWAGLVSFSPGGKRFVGGVQLSLVTQEGEIVIVDLEN